MGVIGNLMFAIGFKVSNGAVQKAEKDLDKLKDSTEGADKSISGLSSGFKTFAAVGVGAMAAVGAAAIGFGHQALTAAEDYQRAMGMIQGATGLTSSQMEEVEGIAKDLYNQNYGKDWEDLSGVLAKTKQITKLTGDQLKETARDALLLRDTEGIDFDVTDSLRAARGMMQNFGITSKEAYNLLVQGAQDGLDANNNLLDTANEYSTQFKALGFSANDMFNMLTAGATDGAFDIDKVADAVKEFNIRAKDGSDSTSEAFQMLGLDANKMMQTFAGGGDKARSAFYQIMQMINDIEDPFEKNKVSLDLMGTQYEDLQTVISSFATGVEQKFDMAKTSMEDLNKIKVETPGQAMMLLGRRIETGVLKPLGDKLLPLSNRFSQWVVSSGPSIDALGQILVNLLGAGIDFVTSSLGKADQAFDTASQFIADHQFGIIVTAGILTAVFGPALLASGIAAVTSGAQITASFVAATAKAGWQATLTGAKITAGLIPSLFRYAYQGWVTTASIIGTTTAWVAQRAVMGISTGLTWAMTAAQWALNAAFLANPLTWVVIGIVALVAAIIWMVTHWDTVTAVMGNVWNAIKDAWGKAMDFLSSIDLVQTGKDIISGLINGIISMGSALWDTAKGIGKSIKDSITGFLDIHSPSRVMMEVGMYTGQGLAEGITDSEEQVSGASAGLAGQVQDPFDASMDPASMPSAASQPATAAASGAGGSEQTIHLVVEVKGETPVSKQTASDLAAELVPLIQNIFESTGRRLGVSTGGAD